MTARLYTSALVSETSFYVNTGNPEDPFAVVHLDHGGHNSITSGAPADLRKLAQVLLDAADELERKQIASGGQP
jgi:hypothetical protein